MSEQTEQEARNLVARLYADWRWGLKKMDTTWPAIQASMDKLIEDVKEQVTNKPVAAEAVSHFKVMRERAAEFVVVPLPEQQTCPICRLQTCVCVKD